MIDHVILNVADHGLRPHYHPSYYAAFVLDPDGNNLEAVCHAPEPGETL
jgi:hypothetical protein